MPKYFVPTIFGHVRSIYKLAQDIKLRHHFYHSATQEFHLTSLVFLIKWIQYLLPRLDLWMLGLYQILRSIQSQIK